MSIFISSQDPSLGPPGTTVQFMIPEGSITLPSEGAAAPEPLPPNHDLFSSAARLVGPTTIFVSQCSCVDQQSYSVFTFEVPEGAEPGIYRFSATFFVNIDTDSISYELGSQLEFRVTKYSQLSQIRTVTPKRFAKNQFSTKTLLYSGDSLDQIQKSTLRIRHTTFGASFRTSVLSHTATELQVRVLTAGMMVPVGDYRLLPTKTAEAEAEVEADNPDAIIVSPASFITVVDSS